MVVPRANAPIDTDPLLNLASLLASLVLTSPFEADVRSSVGTGPRGSQSKDKSVTSWLDSASSCLRHRSIYRHRCNFRYSHCDFDPSNSPFFSLWPLSTFLKTKFRPSGARLFFPPHVELSPSARALACAHSCL